MIYLSVVGAVLLVFGLLLFAYGFSGGGIYAWLGAIVLFIAFILGLKFGFIEQGYLGPIDSGPH